MSALVDIVMPSGQQEGTQSVVSRWLKVIGDTVQQHEPILEISTDKVMMEIACPASGILREILKNENDPIEPGMVLGRLEPGAAAAASSSKVHQRPAAAAANTAPNADASGELSPAVRKLLKEHNLQPSQIRGSGKGGRITQQDVMAYMESGSRGAKPPQAALRGTMQKHDAMRKSIAHHMLMSMAAAPHVTSVFEADLTAIIAHREKNKAQFEAQGVRLTFTAYFIQAAVAALKAVPEVNSRWHDEGLEIFNEFHIGVGTALEDKGLIVPVLRNAEKLSLLETARLLGELTSKARTGALTTAEVQGGTFTISNHGVSGSLVATPIIINQPQSAILGIGKLEKRAVVDQASDEIKVRPMAYITLTIDHRVLDGFKANAFLSTFVKALEEWS